MTVENEVEAQPQSDIISFRLNGRPGEYFRIVIVSKAVRFNAINSACRDLRINFGL